MVFAVAMTFIDQTIVAVSMPAIEEDLHLSVTGAEWIINAYLLTLSALFAFGGKLGDVMGRRSMVVIGVTGFAAASALCGLAPRSAIGEEWIIVARAVQGAFAALLFPASVGIVISAFPVAERGRAMAVFFAITGGLTAVGPLAGGYLTEWTWRAIFWVNIPVAIIALVLIALAKPENVKNPHPINYRSTLLVSGAMGFLILGLQQSARWGWGSAATIGCLSAGLAIGAWFVVRELRVRDPLLNLRIFRDRGFAVDNLILGLLSVPFVSYFFFSSIYAQSALNKSAEQAGLYLLYFFIGFASAAQIGGRILDRRGARPAAIAGGATAAIGFYLLAERLTTLDTGAQFWFIILAGAGMGLMLGPASTDAVNRAGRASYSEVTGITQTARNFGASLGMAVLGTILITQNRTNVTDALVAHNIPRTEALDIAESIGAGASGGGAPPGTPDAVFEAVQHAFAQSTQTVFHLMAAVMVLCFLAALVLPKGKAVDVLELDATPPDASLSDR
jgi:EmrB/QacA subfamily drug resistance transporter